MNGDRWAGIYVVATTKLEESRNVERTIRAAERLAAYALRATAARQGVTTSPEVTFRRSESWDGAEWAIRAEADVIDR
jgi:hypothetical protein